jgi:secondary thiamine-phosphate synthase enzyme
MIKYDKMKSHTEYITINTEKEKEIVNITRKVQDAINKSGVKEGIVLVNSMHITSSVFINDEESGLKQDFMQWLEKLAPEKKTPDGYNHHRTGEVNGDAHLKRTIMGREVVCAITNKELDFGPWEQIFYGEFDGKRNKRILIKIIGE